MSEPGEHISIRRAGLDDVSMVARLIHNTIDVCYSPVYPHAAVEFFKEFHSEDRIAGRLENGDLLVVEHGVNLVATGVTVEDEIFGVFVRPDLQGKGLGAALMAELEQRVIQRGYATSWISVSIPAQLFYKKLGYGPYEARSRDLGNGGCLEFWKASKKLAP